MSEFSDEEAERLLRALNEAEDSLVGPVDRLEDAEPIWLGRTTTDVFRFEPRVRWDSSGDLRFPDAAIEFARVHVMWDATVNPPTAMVAAFSEDERQLPWLSDRHPGLLDFFEPLIASCRPGKGRRG